MHRLASLPLASVFAGGCAADRNHGCEWPGDASASLTQSVQLAEDLAIRYADAQAPRDTWRPDREACEAKLFHTIAAQHGSSVADIVAIREGFAQRGPDLPVYGPMLGLAIFTAWWLVRTASRRFGATEVVPRVVTVAVSTIVLAVAIIGVGQVWAGLVETIRLGNGHLSYRAARIPWGHHRLLTGAGVALAVLLSLALQPRTSSLERTTPGQQPASPTNRNRFYR